MPHKEWQRPIRYQGSEVISASLECPPKLVEDISMHLIHKDWNYLPKSLRNEAQMTNINNYKLRYDHDTYNFFATKQKYTYLHLTKHKYYVHTQIWGVQIFLFIDKN